MTKGWTPLGSLFFLPSCYPVFPPFVCLASCIGHTPGTHWIDARFDECAPRLETNIPVHLSTREKHLRRSAARRCAGSNQQTSCRGVRRQQAQTAIPWRRRLGQGKKQATRRTRGAIGPNTSTGFEASLPIVRGKRDCALVQFRTG